MRQMTLLMLSLLTLMGSAACSDSGGATPAPRSDAGDLEPDVGEADGGDADVAVEPTCNPGMVECIDKVLYRECTAEAAWEEPLRCSDTSRCDPELGGCSPVICAAGQSGECTDETHYSVCNEFGTGYFDAQCPGNSPCDQGSCGAGFCTPLTLNCSDEFTVSRCTEDGAGYEVVDVCPIGQLCDASECQDLCTLNKKLPSYIGCEYWSLDLDNYDDATAQPHAIVVSNPNPELEAEVSITLGLEQVFEHGGPAVIPPLGQGIYQIPPIANISTVEISQKGFHITANVPITAHQFNPLNNLDVYSNDGTLLLPTNALGTEYIVMSWEQRPNPPLRGFLTLINVAEVSNTVRVTPSADTVAGPSVDAIVAGDTAEFELEPGDVLNLQTARVGGDLTGSLVVALEKIGVFGGHECANVLVGINRCDHIESQLFPVDTWGTEYLGAKFFPRGLEPDVWRILASEDFTTIQTEPFIDGVTGTTLNRGEFIQFESSRDFYLNASAPVSVGHYMVGSNWLGIPRVCNEGVDAGNPTGIGDPALTMTVPFNQFRVDYIVLTPDAYAENYLSIVIREGTTVVLDGEAVDASLFNQVGDIPTGFLAAAIPVGAGTHVITADLPFGLDAYGYDCHVSYAYPGGLNLESVLGERK